MVKEVWHVHRLAHLQSYHKQHVSDRLVGASCLHVVAPHMYVYPHRHSATFCKLWKQPNHLSLEVWRFRQHLLAILPNPFVDQGDCLSVGHLPHHTKTQPTQQPAHKAISKLNADQSTSHHVPPKYVGSCNSVDDNTSC